ncbi:PQ-loop repeat-containing protein 1 [Histomonas meleagridis]|uniref:PQ-loop repeat-containing protein 1 n=1 Tax=Histomonas meleagridis TaxID=135588 RepID=UPI00355993DB|nr:PQ-loop repeat-containing protein 1 [Histomonas meleagridis]KAH0797735.1 PQ-loop repeat-containing protein 1 [Histomonas meleagridis]
MVFPTVGYIDTCRLMQKSKSSIPYNFKTVLILLAGNGCKVLYYIYHPYALRIFGQSVSLLIIAFVLTFFKHLYKTNPSNRSTILSYLNPDETSSFHDFVFLISAYTCLFYLIFKTFCYVFGQTYIVEAIGILGNLIDSIISVPTFIQVVVRGNIVGISVVLILQYLLGDVVKIVLFVVSNTPWFFTGGAVFQLLLDSILFIKFFYLKSRSTTKLSIEEERLISPVNSSDESFDDAKEEEDINEEEEEKV